ncbi:unnamed protein product, partial [marine sediment metagenome]
GYRKPPVWTGAWLPPSKRAFGQPVGFFVHSDVVLAGSNATYTTVRIAFGIVMDVELTGNLELRRVVIQPMIWTDPGVGTDPNAPSTSGMVGRIVLVR